MSTLTFLRKFTVRFVLGLAVLAIPNVVLATETSDTELEHGGHGHGRNGVHLNLQVSDESLSEITSLLSQFNSFNCNATGAAAALDAAINSAPQ